MDIRRLTSGDGGLVEAATHLFDGPADRVATQRFLDEPGHHLLIAYQDEDPVGFITGVEVTHPDKGTEMFLYELGVDEGARRRGVGRKLVEALRAMAEERGCYGMWVIADEGNAAAVATYGATGANQQGAQVVFDWSF